MTIKSTLSQVFRKFSKFIPFKLGLCALAARVPPSFRTKVFESFMRELLGGYQYRRDLSVFSNMGISRDLRVLLPLNSGVKMLFGLPENDRLERGALLLAKELAGDCGAFIDIGSHRGLFTFFVRAHLKHSIPIYYVECNPKIYSELHSNILLNRLTNVFGYDCAMGRVSGVSDFYLDETDETCSSLKTEYAIHHRLEKISIASITFDDFVAQQSLNNVLVKVDIENAEWDFLEGARGEFSRIKYLIMEILQPAASQNIVAEIMRRHRVYSYYINDFNLENSEDGTFQYVPAQLNWLFCRLNPDQLSQRLSGTQFKVITSKRDSVENLKSHPNEEIPRL